VVEELMALMPEELRGLSPEEAERAERSGSESLSREQLEARVVELSRYLAAGRLHAKSRLEQALLTRLEAADAANLRDLGDALQRASEEREVSTKKEMQALEADLTARHEEAVQQTEKQAAEEVQALLNADMEQLRSTAQEVLAEERGKRLREVVALNSGLASLEEVLEQDAAAVQRAQIYNGLSVAALRLEEALLAGRSAAPELQALRSAASKADGFVDALLSGLPAGCAKLCQKPAAVPTEPLLRSQLGELLDDLVAAAFVPPNSGLLGGLLGRVFSWFYVLDTGALTRQSSGAAAAEGGSVTEASRNLAALSESCAATKMPRQSGDEGSADLTQALMVLEGSLRGHCREQAAGWLAEAREALLLRQAVRTAKAKAQCLSMATSAA